MPENIENGTSNKKIQSDHDVGAGMELPDTMSVRGATSNLSGLESPNPVAWSERDLIGLAALQTETDIVLVRGTGICVGKYSNPILVHAGTTAQHLGDIKPDLFDRTSLVPIMTILIGPQPERQPDVQKAVADWHPSQTKVYALLVPQAGGGYLRIELGDPTIPQVKLGFREDGAIDLKINNIPYITPKDGVYLHALYQPDLNRIHPSRYIGICKATPVEKIEFLELGQLLLPTPEAVSSWKPVSTVNQRTVGSSEILGSHPALEIPGSRVFIGKNNDWLYDFEQTPSGSIDLRVRSVDKTGKPAYYELLAKGNDRPMIIAEPDPDKRFDARGIIQTLGIQAGGQPTRETNIESITGVILFKSSEDGRILPNPVRTSMTNLQLTKKSLQVEGADITLEEPDGSKLAYQIVNLRDKLSEGFGGGTCDAYAVSKSFIERNPELKDRVFVGGINDFDVLAALEAGKKAQS